MIYCLDTNIISYHLKGNRMVLKHFEIAALNDDKILIPSIAYYEIKRGLIASGATEKMNKFLAFAEYLGIAELKTSTLEIAAQIYADLKKSGEVIEDDDIFIGAIALENNAVLVTNNVAHLGRIKNLKIEV